MIAHSVLAEAPRARPTRSRRRCSRRKHRRCRAGARRARSRRSRSAPRGRRYRLLRCGVLWFSRLGRVRRSSRRRLRLGKGSWVKPMSRWRMLMWKSVRAREVMFDRSRETLTGMLRSLNRGSRFLAWARCGRRRHTAQATGIEKLSRSTGRAGRLRPALRSRTFILTKW